MDRAERLLDLVTLFLNAREPVPFRVLRDHFDDYSGASFDSALRKFERDKAELLELGLPLTYQEPTEADESDGGYGLSRKDYFLPKLVLTPAELTLLGLCGMTALGLEGFRWKQQVARALEKIGFAARVTTEGGEGPRSGQASTPLAGRLAVHTRPRGDPDRVGQAFALLQDAITRRKSVTFSYRALYKDEEAKRTVEPHGLFQRDGAWALNGFCRSKKGSRTFLLDRIEALVVNTAKPKRPDFELPEGLDLGPVARLKPWFYRMEEPLEVHLRLAAKQAFQVQHLFGAAAQVTPAEDGSVDLRLTATYLEPLIEMILSLRSAVTVVAPEGLRDEVKARLSTWLVTDEGEASS